MLAEFDRVLAENAWDVPAGPIVGDRSHEPLGSAVDENVVRRIA